MLVISLCRQSVLTARNNGTCLWENGHATQLWSQCKLMLHVCKMFTPGFLIVKRLEERLKVKVSSCVWPVQKKRHRHWDELLQTEHAWSKTHLHGYTVQTLLRTIKVHCVYSRLFQRQETQTFTAKSFVFTTVYPKSNTQYTKREVDVKSGGHILKGNEIWWTSKSG